MDLLDQAAVTFQLVLTKVDGVKPGAIERKLAEANGIARMHAAAHPDVMPTSSETGTGIPELRAEIAGLG
jgi:GTP-binding protein